VTPPGAETVDVTVTVGGVTSIPADSRQFTYIPVVTALSPATGPENGGTNVSITGAGFALAETNVVFGGKPAASVTCSSATSCMAVSPSGIGTVDLSVTVGGQASGRGPGDLFTYQTADRRGWLHWYSGNSAALRELRYRLVTYDSARANVLLFGASPIDSVPPETWTWNDNDKSAWSQQSPAASPFMGTGLGFSSNNNTAVLFGGLRLAGRKIVLIDSTSLWDGSNWSFVPLGVRPPARTDESMVFDAARGKVILFGGCSNFGCGDKLFNDTWTWDGQTWTQEHPLNSPPARGGASMAFNAADNTIVLFGGQDSINHALGDTWIWNGSNWVQQQPAASPGPRAHGGLAFHPTVHGLLLFGGDLPQILLDTWTWDGTTWRQVVTTGGPQVPPVAMVYDEAARLIFFLDTDAETWSWGGP
jgi:hypothetical protein